jgi:glyoxylase-like metal-dependent hydrolase (beta-lactamase superfamily II)
MKKELILNMSLIVLLLVAKAQAVENVVKPSEERVQFSKLADNVWMHTSYKNVEPWGLIFTNGLVIERDDSSILIDTAWNVQQTAQIIEWAKTKLNKPIKASIHTHAHSDKMGGMFALHKENINTFASSMSNKLAPTHDLIPAKNNLDISSVGDQTQWEGLSVLYPGGGHTHDNIVVYDSESQVIFGGCLIRPGKSGSLGFTGDANLDYWSQAAQNVSNAFPEGNIVVPSHGKPGGREVLNNTIKIAKRSN